MTERPKTTDALYSDRIRLLQTDPERYFKLFPRLQFGFQPSSESGHVDINEDSDQ